MEKKYPILIVDDDRFLLDMYALKFSKNNFVVDTACGSEIALQKLRNGDTYSILLLDIVMPVIDGLQLLETIRNEKLVPDAAIIMLTNQSQTSDIERAKSLGVQGYIVKASTIPSEVVAEVSEMTEKHFGK